MNWLNHGKPWKIAMKFTTKVGFQKWLGEAELGATLCQQNSKHCSTLSRVSCGALVLRQMLSTLRNNLKTDQFLGIINSIKNPSKIPQNSIKTPSIARSDKMLPGTSPGRRSSSFHATASVLRCAPIIQMRRLPNEVPNSSKFYMLNVKFKASCFTYIESGYRVDPNSSNLTGCSNISKIC